MLLHRSDLNISESFRQIFSHVFNFFFLAKIKICKNSLFLNSFFFRAQAVEEALRPKTEMARSKRKHRFAFFGKICKNSLFLNYFHWFLLRFGWQFCRNFADNLENVENFWNFEFSRGNCSKFLNFERIRMVRMVRMVRSLADRTSQPRFTPPQVS